MPFTAPPVSVRAARLGSTLTKILTFVAELPPGWERTMPGTVGAACAELVADAHATIADLDAGELPDEYADELAGQLDAALAAAQAACPPRPGDHRAETFNLAVHDTLLKQPDVKQIMQSAPVHLLMLSLISVWCYDGPSEHDALDALHRTWEQPDYKQLRNLYGDTPHSVFETLCGLYREQRRRTTPTVCRVSVRGAALVDGPIDVVGLALRAGVKASNGRVGFAVYPDIVAHWLAAPRTNETDRFRLRRSALPVAYATVIDGADTDLDDSQWHAALVLHEEATDGPYLRADAAIRAARHL